MITALVLLAIGLFMIFIEFFLPGGIMGIIGSILVVVSIAFFAVDAQSGWIVVAYIIGVAVAVGALIKFSLWRIQKGKVGGIYLNSAQEGYFASEFSKEIIGKKGEAISDLKPSGHILVEGNRYQAVSKTGYILKGSKIEVIGGEGAHYIVKEASHNNS